MSHNDVQHHFNDQATENMASVLGTLMEIIKNNPAIKLTEDQSNILKVKKDDVKLSSKSVVEIYRSRLLELWEKYEDPKERKASKEAEYHRWVKEQRKKIRNTRTTRDEDKTEDRKAKAEADDQEFIDSLIEPIKMEGKICYGIDLATLSIDYSQPLQFCEEIKLSLIEDCIMISPLTKLVDINKTLRKVLEKGKLWGWTRTQVSILLKLFVKEHLAINYTCIAYLEEPTEIWDAVSNMIDFSSAETTILQAMKSLKRKKGHGIVTVIGAYRSLAFDLHEIKSPYATKEECLTEADKDAVKVVKWFIEPNLSSLLKGISDKIKYEEKRRVTLKEVTDFVNKYEMNAEYKLKSDKSLDKFDITQISIFKCEVVENDDAPPSPGDEDVYTMGEKKEESLYERIDSSTPSTMRKDSFYGSNSSLISSSSPGHVPRGRTPKTRSPFTERKRLYIRGKNGERRSVSRNKIETFDESQKKFVPRPLSRSRERPGQRPRSKSISGRCLLCNVIHPGICHYYGSIKPTEKPCGKCGGRHPQEICKGKRSTTPNGTRSSSQGREGSSKEETNPSGEKEKPDWFPKFNKKNLN